MLILQQRVFAVDIDDRVFMAGACCGEPACADLEDAQPYRHEHIGVVAGADLLVDSCEYLRRSAAHKGLVVDEDF